MDYHDKLFRDFLEWLGKSLNVKWYEALDTLDENYHYEIREVRVKHYLEIRNLIKSNRSFSISRAILESGLIKGPGSILSGHVAPRQQYKTFLMHKKTNYYINNLLKKPNEEGIETFIRSAKNIKNGPSNDSLAAKLASVILTIKYPNKFVDYTKMHWTRFAELFFPDIAEEIAYINSNRAGYGKRLIWAGKIAKRFSDGETFKKVFNKKKHGYPNWLTAGFVAFGKDGKEYLKGGITYFDIIEKIAANSPPASINLPIRYLPLSEYEAMEGERLRREYTLIKRNAKLVQEKKKRSNYTCEICGFNFEKTYGKIGIGYIQCHHIEPLKEKKRAHKTGLDDLMLVCANCHCMLHRGDPALTKEELKKEIKRVKGEN